MSNERFDPQKAAMKLLSHLRSMKNDRGAMANLRGALRPAQRHRAWPLLGPVGGIGNVRYETVAAFYAYQPDETRIGNLGTTCRLLSSEHNSFDGRFRRLLTCDREEICERLAPVIFAAKAKGVPVNYEQLFVDLCYWSDKVKERWAREYWGGPEADMDAADTAERAE
jgi:CRISPR type I-E-associated protein CasB/Cse2